MRARTIAPLMLLVAASGCSSGSKNEHKTASTAPAVAWVAEKPPQLVERAPVKTLCRAGDLATLGQVKFAPRLQGGVALVAIRNRGSRTCRLTGRPRVRFVHNGGPEQVQKPFPTTPANFPALTYPASSLRALRPGDFAFLTIAWDNWCDPVVKGKPHVPPSALQITLPGGRGHLDADYNAVVQCVDLNSPSTIGVSTFQPSLVRAALPWSNVLLRASVPGQPIHGRRGQMLRFRVVLRNAGQSTVRFVRCPAYAEQLVPSGSVEAYELDCREAHPIEPGKSLAFATRIRVPRDAPIGANGLFWELDPFGARDPQVHARVKVDR